MVKYFTAEEVARHNCQEDCWVSIFHNVYDITDLLAQNPGELSAPLLKNAGMSISHWFDKDSGDIKTFIDPQRNIRLPYCPGGRFIDIPPPDPRAILTAKEKPWWLDPKYMTGKLTLKIRLVKIINTLTQNADVIKTCTEETIDNISDRYMEYNKHARSYTWKYLVGESFLPIRMDWTLTQNGMVDESDKFIDLGMNDDFDIPTLHLYFNDDLTYA